MIPNTSGTLTQRLLSSPIECKALKLKPHTEATIGEKADLTKYAVSVPLYNANKMIVGYNSTAKNYHLFESYSSSHNQTHHIQLTSTGAVALSFDIKRSFDGVNWEAVSTTAVPAGTMKIVTVPTVDNLWYLIVQTVETVGSTYYVNAR